MNDLQWYDWIRLVTALLAFASMWRLAHVVRYRRSIGQVAAKKTRDFVWVLHGYLFTQTFGALETASQDAPYRWSILLSFILAVIAFRATRKSDEPLFT